MRTSSSGGCADSFGVTICLYREKHLAVVGNPCNGTIQVRYGWATVLCRLQQYLQEAEKSGVILKYIEKAEKLKKNLLFLN